MCILLLFWGSRPLQFKASAVISVHNKSFPICFCPQMLWLGRNMLWLHIPKQRYGSSGGQPWRERVASQQELWLPMLTEIKHDLMLTVVGRLKWRSANRARYSNLLQVCGESKTKRFGAGHGGIYLWTIWKIYLLIALSCLCGEHEAFRPVGFP